jgi:hypothetical protein
VIGRRRNDESKSKREKDKEIKKGRKEIQILQ